MKKLFYATTQLKIVFITTPLFCPIFIVKCKYHENTENIFVQTRRRSSIFDFFLFWWIFAKVLFSLNVKTINYEYWIFTPYTIIERKEWKLIFPPPPIRSQSAVGSKWFTSILLPHFIQIKTFEPEPQH